MKNISIRMILLAAFCLPLAGCQKSDGESPAEHHNADAQHGEGPGHGEHQEEHGHPQHKIVVTSPVEKDVITTQQYVCQIHSCRHIELCALEGGYLEEILVQEGQAVKKGDLVFKILPTLYQARLDSDVAEAQLAEIEFQNTKKLFEQRIGGRSVVSDQEVALAKAKLQKAQANVKLAQAELDFADVKAPFDGIVDRQHQQLGSLIDEGDILTTLSDNSVMWVYFNVPEARYLEYKASVGQDDDDLTVELMLANHQKFPQIGRIGAVEADFDNETGNIQFRADFPNPDGLLRHGQTGNVVLSKVVKDAIVIPQRATYEILAKKYAYVVGEDGVVHQRDITIQNELPDIYVIRDGLDPNDKIILEGIRQVRDGDKVECEFQSPEEVLENLKYHAE